MDSGLGNGNGVFINIGSFNTIGGTSAAAGNLISGNGSDGIEIIYGATNNFVQGNLIGTDLNGTADLGNGASGVKIDSASRDNTIGGTTSGARNVISGNTQFGVEIRYSAGNDVTGNFIGTDLTGTVALGNDVGTLVGTGSGNNIIGGIEQGAGNVISGNNGRGVLINGFSTTTQVLGNLIGIDVTGVNALGNGDSGIVVSHSSGNTIGGATANARNVISGNGGTGITIEGPINGPGTASDNLVQGNFIGTDATGSLQLGNLNSGISFRFDARDNLIGGNGSGAGNTIAFNVGDGVSVNSATSTAILSNSIFSNMGLGIDLGQDGVTPNDAGDADTGPNELQNYPVLNSATRVAAGTTQVDGALNSTTTATFRLEFFANSACDASGNGEGESFLGYLTSTTGGTGSVSFSASFAAAVSPGHFEVSSKSV